MMTKKKTCYYYTIKTSHKYLQPLSVVWEVMYFKLSSKKPFKGITQSLAVSKKIFYMRSHYIGIWETLYLVI